MEEYVRTFKALSDETRLRILRLLAISNRSLCVCELVETLKMPQYQISKHLSILKNAGLVTHRQSGTWVYYSPNYGNSLHDHLFNLFKDNMINDILTQDASQLAIRLLQRGSQCSNKSLNTEVQVSDISLQNLTIKESI